MAPPAPTKEAQPKAPAAGRWARLYDNGSLQSAAQEEALEACLSVAPDVSCDTAVKVLSALAWRVNDAAEVLIDRARTTAVLRQWAQADARGRAEKKSPAQPPRATPPHLPPPAESAVAFGAAFAPRPGPPSPRPAEGHRPASPCRGGAQLLPPHLRPVQSPREARPPVTQTRYHEIFEASLRRQRAEVCVAIAQAEAQVIALRAQEARVEAALVAAMQAAAVQGLKASASAVDAAVAEVRAAGQAGQAALRAAFAPRYATLRRMLDDAENGLMSAAAAAWEETVEALEEAAAARCAPARAAVAQACQQPQAIVFDAANGVATVLQGAAGEIKALAPAAAAMLTGELNTAAFEAAEAALKTALTHVGGVRVCPALRDAVAVFAAAEPFVLAPLCDVNAIPATAEPEAPGLVTLPGQPPACDDTAAFPPLPPARAPPRPRPSSQSPPADGERLF